MTEQSEPYLEPGVLLAERYEVVRAVGMGSTGWVVQVLDRELDGKTVALKVLHSHLIADEDAFARFRNEVLVTRELAHPNIMRVYDIGKAENNQYFISMEFLEGRSLAARLADPEVDPLRFEEIVPILYEMSIGLAHAHGHGVIHRDLKPDNIMLTAFGGVKLTDFGIARALWQDHSVSLNGQVLGTPHYMAPEQIRGDGALRESDVYSLGIIAFQLAAGALPFDDDSFFNLAQMHLHKPLPSFVSAGVEVPPWFESLVRSAVEKVASERISSAENFAKTLQEHMARGEVPVFKRSLLSRIRRPLGRVVGSRKVKRGKAVRRVKELLLFILFVLVLVFWLRTDADARKRAAVPLLYAEKEFALSEEFLLPLKRVLRIQGSVLRSEDLLHAVLERRRDVMYSLTAAGADPNVRDASGRTPLHYAVRNADEHAVRLLLTKGEWWGYPGADPNVIDDRLESPLHIAARTNQGTIIRQLLDAGADSELLNDSGSQAIHLAAGRDAVTSMAQLLLEHPDLHVRNKHGDNLLHLAVRSGAEHSLRMLLREIPLNLLHARDGQMRSSMHLAVSLGDDIDTSRVLGIVRQLIDADPTGALIELPDAEGATPLLYAAYRRDPVVLDLLLEHGADSRVQDSKGRSVLSYSIVGRNSEAVDLLLSQTDSVETLLALEDAGGQRSLAEAVRLGTMSMLSSLLRAYELNSMLEQINDQDNEGETALMHAARKGKPAMVNLLLFYGADTKLKNKGGKRAAEFAPPHAKERIEKLLRGK